MRLHALLLSVLFALSPLCFAEARKTEPTPVGVVIPLSGDLAFFGTALRQGIEMAANEGRTAHLKLIFEDDGSGDRTITVTALRSLISRHGIKAAVLTAMPNVVVADPIAQREDIIVLSAWDSNHEIEKLSPHTLGYGWSNEITGQAMGTFAISRLKAKSAAIIVAQDEWSELMSTAFRERFTKDGGAIVLQAPVNLDDTDFRSLAAKVARLNPDVVYFPLYRASLLSFARQIKQAGYSGTLLSAEGITAAEVQQLGSLADGMYVTSAHLEDAAFEDRYKTAFKLPRVELNLAHVALGYEIADFLNTAIESVSMNGEPVSARTLRAAIDRVSVEGPLGRTSFKGKKTTDRSQVILVAKNSTLTLVSASGQ